MDMEARRIWIIQLILVVDGEFYQYKPWIAICNSRICSEDQLCWWIDKNRQQQNLSLFLLTLVIIILTVGVKTIEKKNV